MDKFEYLDCEGTVDLERIKYVEKKIGYKFPQSYLDCLSQCDGCTPVKDEFKYIDSDSGEEAWGGISRYLCINEAGSDHDLLRLFLDPPEFFPNGVVPFGDTGGGDYICFDYRNDNNSIDPPIVYWSHEGEIGNDLSFVSKNFEEFLSILEQM